MTCYLCNKQTALPGSERLLALDHSIYIYMLALSPFQTPQLQLSALQSSDLYMGLSEPEEEIQSHHNDRRPETSADLTAPHALASSHASLKQEVAAGDKAPSEAAQSIAPGQAHRDSAVPMLEAHEGRSNNLQMADEDAEAGGSPMDEGMGQSPEPAAERLKIGANRKVGALGIQGQARREPMQDPMPVEVWLSCWQWQAPYRLVLHRIRH